MHLPKLAWPVLFLIILTQIAPGRATAYSDWMLIECSWLRLMIVKKTGTVLLKKTVPDMMS